MEFMERGYEIWKAVTTVSTVHKTTTFSLCIQRYSQEAVIVQSTLPLHPVASSKRIQHEVTHQEWQFYGSS